MMEIKTEILNIMDSNGIEYSDGKMSGEIESMQFVSALIELEECFNVEFPESMIRADVFYDLDILT